jgi:hypothetical protein
MLIMVMVMILFININFNNDINNNNNNDFDPHSFNCYFLKFFCMIDFFLILSFNI